MASVAAQGEPPRNLPSDVARAIARARTLGLTVATAESLTGGLVAGALTSVAGASDVFLGGVVAYAPDIKTGLLGVPRDVLESVGPVSEEVALALAHGARRALGADIAVATTGVAGPEPHGGKPPGMFWVAAIGPGAVVVRRFVVVGGRDDVRAEATRRAIRALCDVIDDATVPGTRVG